MELLNREAEVAPELRRLEYAGGQEMTYRDFGRLREEPLALMASALALMRVMAAHPEVLSEQLDKLDAWLSLVPMLTAPEQVSCDAVQVMAACAKKTGNCAMSLSELGGGEALVELALNCRKASTREAACVLIRECIGYNTFQQSLSASHGVPNLCELLTPSASGPQVVALAESLRYLAENDRAVTLAYLCTGRRGFCKLLVDMWYARKEDVRDAVEYLMVAIMADERGANTLQTELDEGAVQSFVHDLQTKRANDKAKATGGANILNPGAIGLATSWGGKLNPGEDDPVVSPQPNALPCPPELAAREAEVSKMDLDKLSRYIGTLLPPSTAQPVFVEGRSGTGSLALKVAIAFPNAHVYAAEEQRHLVDDIVSRTAKEGITNATPVLCEAGSLRDVPSFAHVVILACLPLQTEEPNAMLGAAAHKLRPDGKLVLIDDDINFLAECKSFAQSLGLVFFSQPDLFADHYVMCFVKP